MDSHAEVGFTYGPAVKTNNPQASRSSSSRDFAYDIIPGPKFLHTHCTSGENDVDTPTAVVRTSIQRQVGGYRKDLPHAGDMEMWLRFAANAAVGFIRADQAYYRLHGQNMSVAFMNLRDFVERKAVFDSFFREYGDCIEGGKELQRLAQRGLATHAFWTASQLFEEAKVTDCGKYLGFALGLCPSLRYSRPWCFFRIKQLLGPKAWSMMRPLIYCLRDRVLGRPFRAA
jgi:hypothetical protein